MIRSLIDEQVSLCGTENIPKPAHLKDRPKRGAVLTKTGKEWDLLCVFLKNT